MWKRYNAIDEKDLQAAAARLNTYLEANTLLTPGDSALGLHTAAGFQWNDYCLDKLLRARHDIFKQEWHNEVSFERQHMSTSHTLVLLPGVAVRCVWFLAFLILWFISNDVFAQDANWYAQKVFEGEVSVTQSIQGPCFSYGDCNVHNTIEGNVRLEQSELRIEWEGTGEQLHVTQDGWIGCSFHRGGDCGNEKQEHFFYDSCYCNSGVCVWSGRNEEPDHETESSPATGEY